MSEVVYIPWEEPRVRRRFWASARRARKLAEEAITGGVRPARFVVVVRAGVGVNSTSVGDFLVGHLGGVITSVRRLWP